jgi:hypothetical protein
MLGQMKKRAQLPNAQTFTVIFRGCAGSQHPKLAVSEAIRIYHSMMSNDRLQPNTIHMNAVLEVCARAGDIESLFSIAKTANEGVRSPNSQTYTIILNGIRPRRDPARREGGSSLTPEETEQNTKMAVNRAKAIWEEVVARWRKGKLQVDEHLVCAMGRVLLLGSYQDSNSILSLVEQTMALPRLDLVEGNLTPPETVSKASGEEHPREQSKRLVRTSRTGLAVPSQKTLSLILTSLGRTRKSSLGPKYWDLLTKTYHIQPDADNYVRMLVLLMIGKASGRTADLVEQMPVSFLTEKTFRTALSTCLRDNVNRHAFSNATRVFDTMVSKLSQPDPESIRLYLSVARANFRKFNEDDEASSSTQHHSEEAKLALGRQIVAALDRTLQPFLLLTAGNSSSSSRKGRALGVQWTVSGNARREAIAVARRMVAAMDAVVTERMASEDVLKVIKTRRNLLNSQVVRFFEDEQKSEKLNHEPDTVKARDNKEDIIS